MNFGAGVTVDFTQVQSDAIVAVAITILATASVGPRPVTVTTINGTSNALDFTITAPLPPPTLGFMDPVTGARGAVLVVTLVGTGFVQRPGRHDRELWCRCDGWPRPRGQRHVTGNPNLDRHWRRYRPPLSDSDDGQRHEQRANLQCHLTRLISDGVSGAAMMARVQTRGTAEWSQALPSSTSADAYAAGAGRSCSCPSILALAKLSAHFFKFAGSPGLVEERLQIRQSINSQLLLDGVHAGLRIAVDQKPARPEEVAERSRLEACDQPEIFAGGGDPAIGQAAGAVGST